MTLPERLRVASEGHDVAVAIVLDDHILLLREAAERITQLENALAFTATMLAFEATCHEESGDPVRRRYVTSLRGAVGNARALLAAPKEPV